MNGHDEDGEGHDYGLGSNQLLRQLAYDVREMRKTQEGQARDISDLRVTVGKMEAKQGQIETTLAALQPVGRPETYVRWPDIRQALIFALVILLFLAAVYALSSGRP